MSSFSLWSIISPSEAVPIPNHTATTVAKALMKNVFVKYGMPAEILTDRGSEFESELFSQLLDWLQIGKLRTTAYKHSTNGAVERFHRTLNTVLGKLVSSNKRDWYERLPYALAAYRATVHTSTGFTPNRLFLGRENCLPIDLAMGLPINEVNGTRTVDDYVERQQQLAEETFQLVRENLSRNAQRRKSAYDVKVRETSYSAGDDVWYYYPRRYTRKSPKWQRCYIGPYRVTRAIPPVNYVIQRSPKSQPFVVHTDKLKRCYSPSAAWSTTNEPAQEGLAATAVTVPSAISPRRRQPSSMKRQQKPREPLAEPPEEVEVELGSGSQHPTRARKPPAYLSEYACCSLSLQN